MLGPADGRRRDVALVFLGAHRRGGVERSVWELARHLRHDHDVTVYAREVDRSDLDGVDVVEVDSRGGPAAAWHFARAARARVRPDHDHVISFGIGDDGADVLWVNSVHRAWLERAGTLPGAGLANSRLRRALPQHRLLLGMERAYFSGTPARRVVVVADRVGQDLTRLYGVPPSRLVTIHNGFDPAEFSPARRSERDDARRELGLPVDAVVLLMVANELPRKGFGEVLEATARLGRDDVHVLLVGRTAPDAYGRRISELGLEGRFTYAGSQADVGRVHQAADLFVLPTRYEAFCLAIVESLASGLPVITSTVPGAGDLVTDGTCGRLLQDPTSVDELVAALRGALEPGVLSAWAAAAPAAVADLTWAGIAAQAAAVLEPLPSRRGWVRR